MFHGKKDVYRDRTHAGEILAELLIDYIKDAVILCIPNGGVPVAEAVAQKLSLPYDLLIVRKIKIPYNPEAGFGAVTPDKAVVFNERLLNHLRLTDAQVQRQVDETLRNIEDRMKFYKPTGEFLEVSQRRVILMDDGLASGYTMIAAINSLKRKEIKSLIVAVPTAPDSTIARVKPLVDKIICPNIRSTPFAVADAYKHWYDLDDEEVLQILANSRFYHENMESQFK